MKRNGCLATVTQDVHDCIMMILWCAVSVFLTMLLNRFSQVWDLSEIMCHRIFIDCHEC